ncbi:MAG: hypothetical protein KDK25_08225 [Leptospiraceae bacterium]|nr:hypothetical protein [Leptospiraceae bacterium]
MATEGLEVREAREATEPGKPRSQGAREPGKVRKGMEARAGYRMGPEGCYQTVI